MEGLADPKVNPCCFHIPLPNPAPTPTATIQLSPTLPPLLLLP